MSDENELNSELFAAPILVVDDDPVSRHFIEKTLRSRGFHNIHSVESAVRAIELFHVFRPELTILDIHMPGVNGLECCEWIRMQPSLRDLPVLMLTSLTDETLRYRAFEAGATDFVSKPLHPDELYGRVKVHLQNRLSTKRLQRYIDRIAMELHTARELQQDILPQIHDVRNLAEREKLNIASHLNTSSEIGGDFWGMKHLFPNHTALWMVDFSGHGVAAALNAFRLQAYLNEHSEFSSRPGEYISRLNEKMLHLLPRGYFATMFYGLIDTQGHTIHYSCACNPHPILRRRNGDVELLDGSGMPVGVNLQHYQTRSVAFHPGDTLMLYSDALIETRNKEGQFITEDMLMRLLASHNGNAEELKDTILSFFDSHAVSLTDDLTLCICQWTD